MFVQKPFQVAAGHSEGNQPTIGPGWPLLISQLLPPMTSDFTGGPWPQPRVQTHAVCQSLAYFVMPQICVPSEILCTSDKALAGPHPQDIRINTQFRG